MARAYNLYNISYHCFFCVYHVFTIWNITRNWCENHISFHTHFACKIMLVFHIAEGLIFLYVWIYGVGVRLRYFTLVTSEHIASTWFIQIWTCMFSSWLILNLTHICHESVEMFYQKKRSFRDFSKFTSQMKTYDSLPTLPVWSSESADSRKFIEWEKLFITYENNDNDFINYISIIIIIIHSSIG